MIQEVTVTPQKLLVVWTGIFDAAESAKIQQGLIDYIYQGNRMISIDLSGIEYIDAAGLGVLVSINKVAMKNGGHVEIRGLHGMGKDLFELTRLDKVFDIK